VVSLIHLRGYSESGSKTGNQYLSDRFGCGRNRGLICRDKLCMTIIGGAREATADEQRAIDKHREEHPKGKHHYRDEGDQSLLLARPQLRCTDDGEKLTVPVRIL
jgi:hypothetical protein